MLEPRDGAVLGVLSTRAVADGREPVRIVVHDRDGDWQFLCGTTTDEADAVIVGVDHLLAADASLEDLLSLPRGTRAVRDEPGAPWRHERSAARRGRGRVLARLQRRRGSAER